MERFDLVVIGSGAGGLTAATVARGLGATVALVERDRLGGECTWRGCVPSKTLLAAARAASLPSDFERLGLALNSPVAIDTSGVMAHVRAVRAKVGEHDSAEVLAARGIEVLKGEARFLGPQEVDVRGQRVTARRFVVATGSRPNIPPIPGLDETTALTPDNLWDTDTIPASLAILGGGPVAVEMASAFSRLGTRVTMLVRSKLLRAEDSEMVELLSAVLISQGVHIVNGLSLERVEASDVGFRLSAGDRTFDVERLLVAAGRTPVLPDGLDAAGVDVTAHGIVTDSHMRTTAHHIFAVGDVAGPYRFTHTAERAGIAAATNALLPVARKVSWHDIVWVLFTDPELAHLGMTEDQARKEHGDAIHVRCFDFAKQDRARAEGVKSGLAKYILDRRGHLLGAHILGERAGELIHEAAVLLHHDMPFSSLSPVMHAYPTLADAVKRPADAEYAQHLRDNPLVRGALAILPKPKARAESGGENL